MKNKKLIIFGMFLLFVILPVVIFSENLSAVGEATVCCEKTTDGAWCQDVSDETECDTSSYNDNGDKYRSAPTSCEATSYCKLGTCVVAQDGVCMSSVPAKVCKDTRATGGIAAGIWYDSEPGELKQCQLGCCLIGNQAAFTTQTKCKQMSSDYGLGTNYRSDIQSEVECISSATPKVKGACVFEEEFQRTCRFVTKEECQNLESSGIENVEFNAGLLCSAIELGTNCGSSEKTTILEGKDEVYFIDTCGNPANIYDEERQSEPDCISGSSGKCGYWEKIVPKTLSCNYLESNAGSATCGNCDYFLGSAGSLYNRARDGTPSPNFGDYMCRDLSCGNVDGDDRLHGETWCENSAKSENLANAPGSRYFRKVCYNGDVTVEPCADYRQEICIEDSIPTDQGEFSTAACRVNKWQECVGQSSQKDCTNTDRRDCSWSGGRCIPKNYPGFDFWNSETDAKALCFQASDDCQARFERGFAGGTGDFKDIIGKFAGQIGGRSEHWECVSGCDCVGMVIDQRRSTNDDDNNKLNINLDNSWTANANNICIALGDCGVSVNSQNDEGYYDINDFVSSKGLDAPQESNEGLFGL